MLEARRLARNRHRQEYDHVRRAFISHGEELRSDGRHLHAQLLGQLPRDRVHIRLARLTLAARKLPQPTVPLVVRALAYEQGVAALDDCGDHADRPVRHARGYGVTPMRYFAYHPRYRS